MPVEYRRLGRTDHHSSVAILGGCAFGPATEEETAAALTRALEAGVNHLDIAPSYGHAEAVVGPLIPAVRDRLFISCKTMHRTRDEARRELEGSLERLRTDMLDVYQLHAVTTDADLDAALAPGGAVETLQAAKDEGLVRFLGITGHFEEAPRVFRRALDVIDLDTVMFPVNGPMWALPEYRADAEELLSACADRDVGVMAIKAVARGFWAGEQRYGTWYEPLDDPADMAHSIAFTLSLPVHGFATPCDLRLLDDALAAARAFTPLSPDEMEASVTSSADREALVRPAN